MEQQETNFFSVASSFRSKQVLSIYILGISDPGDCKISPLKTGCSYANSPLKIGFTLLRPQVLFIRHTMQEPHKEMPFRTLITAQTVVLRFRLM